MDWHTQYGKRNEPFLIHQLTEAETVEVG